MGQDRGLPHGNLHIGNILIRDGCAVVCTPTGFLLGVQSRHRSQALGLKGVTNLASLDMYCFGHILYEMSFGRPLPTPTLDTLPPECPDIVKTALLSLLSPAATKSELPSISSLLSSPLFSLDLPQPQTKLKLSSSTKESLKTALKQAEDRLEEDKTAVKAQKRESKVKKEVEVDNAVRRKAARKKLKENGEEEKIESISPAAPVSTSPPAPAPPAPAAPPPPPPPSNGPSPPPPPPPASAPPPSSSAPPPASAARGALLGSITGFKKGGLKKTTTVDKSAPRI